MSNFERTFFKENHEKLNASFGTNIPWNDSTTCLAMWQTVFSVYPFKEYATNCIKDGMTLDELTSEIENSMCDLVYYNNKNMIVFFSEVNYDFEKNVVIGDFTEEEISEIYNAID